MNIKFKDSEEYKSLMQDLKKESLKVKNENIHLTAQMKHLAKEHEELKMIDDIVKSYLNAIGYEIDDYGDSENEEELDNVIIGIYKPNISKKVDPDIPGKIIAEIAREAAKKT